jgi:hypothetical protein
MKTLNRWIVSTVLVASMTTPLISQRDGFYNGVRSRNGYNDNYDRRYYDRHNQGGIGPGKGALIGGAGGAALGAIFGGGLKGALIGGGAGAGVGAIAGKVHQDNRRRDYRERYDNYGRPY